MKPVYIKAIRATISFSWYANNRFEVQYIVSWEEKRVKSDEQRVKSAEVNTILTSYIPLHSSLAARHSSLFLFHFIQLRIHRYHHFLSHHQAAGFGSAV